MALSKAASEYLYGVKGDSSKPGKIPSALRKYELRTTDKIQIGVSIGETSGGVFVNTWFPIPHIKTEGLTITRETIWSEKTGRTKDSDAEMVGNVIAKKWKYQIQFSPLNPLEMWYLFDLLEDADSANGKGRPDFFDIRFVSPRYNALKKRTVYTGDFSIPLYSYVEGLPTYVGVNLHLIDK